VFLMCERGGIGRRPRLINLSAHKETYGVEPVKFGEGCKMLIPSQASDRISVEGVETRRQASKAFCYDEGIVQTTNC
jgi:hypothetical protein